MSTQGLPAYSAQEVASHNTTESLWVIIDGKVYDVTSFQENHPGGPEVLLDNAGKDASVAFANVGHSEDAIQLRDSTYLIGTLKAETHQCCGGNCGMVQMGALVVGLIAVGLGVYFVYKKLKN